MKLYLCGSGHSGCSGGACGTGVLPAHKHVVPRVEELARDVAVDVLVGHQGVVAVRWGDYGVKARGGGVGVDERDLSIYGYMVKRMKSIAYLC